MHVVFEVVRQRDGGAVFLARLVLFEGGDFFFVKVGGGRALAQRQARRGGCWLRRRCGGGAGGRFCRDAAFAEVDVVGFDGVAFNEGQRAFEDVFEFAHVAGEGVGFEFGQRRR